MSPSDYEMIEQGYDPPRMTYSNERVEEIVAELEAVMEGLPPSQPDASAGLSDDEKRLVLKLPIVRALIASWRTRGEALQALMDWAYADASNRALSWTAILDKARAALKDKS